MSLTNIVSQIFFWFPVLALLLLTFIFVWRRTYRELPLFFAYIVSAWLIGVIRYSSFRLTTRGVYFYSYWISELAGAVFVSLALYEIFLRRLFAKFHKTRFYGRLFPAVAFAILLLTIITALQSADKRAAFQAASRAFDFARTAALVFFLALMLFMGRVWTRYDLGVALGFGIQAAAALANAAVRARLQHRSELFDLIEVITYEAACLIWVITFAKPEKRRPFQTADPLSQEMLHEARKWESVLKDWLTPGKR